MNKTKQANKPNDWENLAVQHRNRMEPRAFFTSFPSEHAVKSKQSPFTTSLNGNWKFHFSGNPARAPENFFEPEFDDSSWNNIPVPSSWQLQGYGTHSPIPSFP